MRFWHHSQLLQHRATTLYYGRRFAGWLSTIIGIDEPTGVILLPYARFIGDCEVVFACSDELLTVEEYDLAGSGQPNHAAAL
jgi:hypothetical protein